MILAACVDVVGVQVGILVCAIWRTWSIVTVATLVVSLAAALVDTGRLEQQARGGRGLQREGERRSSNTEISTGTMSPRCDSVAAL